MWKILLITLALYLSSQDCKYDWQCLTYESPEYLSTALESSLQYEAGRLFTACTTASDCYSGCCKDKLCNLSLMCQNVCQDGKCDEALDPEIVRPMLEQASVKPVNNGACDYNFECLSQCCQNGVCAAQACFQVDNQFCYYDSDCSSNCCKDSECVCTEECYGHDHLVPPCQFNHQCASSCCQDGMCASDSEKCSSQLKIENACSSHSECESSCCSESECVNSVQCVDLMTLLREDNPHYAALLAKSRLVNLNYK